MKKEKCNEEKEIKKMDSKPDSNIKKVLKTGLK